MGGIYFPVGFMWNFVFHYLPAAPFFGFFIATARGRVGMIFLSIIILFNVFEVVDGVLVMALGVAGGDLKYLATNPQKLPNPQSRHAIFIFTVCFLFGQAVLYLTAAVWGWRRMRKRDGLPLLPNPRSAFRRPAGPASPTSR